MRRGRWWLLLVIATVVGSCTDAPSGPASRDAARAPLAAPWITVPARPGCSAKKGAGSLFGRGKPRFGYSTSADSLKVDSTAYEPWDPSEVPAVEYSSYYDLFSDEPCYDVYERCVAACTKLPKKVDRAICYIACMDWYSGCLAEKYLPPSLRPCGPVTTISYDPEPSECDPDGSFGSTGGGGTSGGANCHDEYTVIEISYDDGVTWHKWWEGWATVCG
jgi:hypothetical protein